MAFAAPVEVGTMLSAAARARRRSLCGPSCRFWSCVYAWIVVIRPRSMVNASWMALAIGARQFVVHEALEMIVCAWGSYWSWFTPITTVRSSFFAGAEMSTFLAPPSTCARALAASVKRPVDSMTTSAPRSPHGSAEGSRSSNALMLLPATVMSFSVYDTSPGSRPRIESYFSRWARLLLSVRSLTPTTSMSAPDASAARKKLRPMRPKPLMPTRTVTGVMPPGACAPVRSTGAAGGFGRGGRPRARIDPIARRVTPVTRRPSRRDRSGVQHLRRQVRLGAGDALVRGPLVRHGQQPTDPAGHGVLGHRRVGELSELLETRLLVRQPKLTGLAQVVGHVVAEDLQCALDPRAGRDRGTGGPAQVRVVEVG